MTWTLDYSGTKTATVAGTATFGASSYTVTMANTAAAGDMVVLSGTTAPGGFSFGTTYYVSATSLSSSSFELAATSGGAPIEATSAGSAVTATIEHVLATDSNNGTLAAEIDTTNMALGDLVTLRAYTVTLSGGAWGKIWEGTYQHPQICLHKQFPPIPSDQDAMFTLSQGAGTGRAFAWKILRI